MPRTRFLVSTTSVLTILGGALLLTTPQPASASFAGCPTSSVKAAISDLGDICSGSGSGVINCYSDGTWDWASVSCG